jgi:ferredoxin
MLRFYVRAPYRQYSILHSRDSSTLIATSTRAMTTKFLRRSDFGTLLRQLGDAGYRCVGPMVRDGAIVYDTVGDASQLPQGVTEIQAPGSYRLTRGDSPRCFAWANGPQALKPLTFAPRERIWQARRDAGGALRFDDSLPDGEAIAAIGVRACDLAALYLQDKHFLHGVYVDPYYVARRRKLFIVAVNCTHAADTCFCASTGDGPRATYGYDLALGELDDGFLIEARSVRGGDVLRHLPVIDATDRQVRAHEQELHAAAARQTRRLPSRNLKAKLFARLEHPRWADVGARCLSCGNCTSVCPTCFCHAEKEQPQLDGMSSEHYREWDSCFTQTHSYIHGITIRADTPLRYRQWLTHKLGSWHDQYGRSGCVGCGRCITWCPVGIDITEEAAAICGEAGNG